MNSSYAVHGDESEASKPAVESRSEPVGPDWKGYAMRLHEALKCHAHAASDETGKLIVEVELIKHLN